MGSTVANELYIRGAKGAKDTKWYQTGTRNGGQIGINGQNYEVQYLPVNDKVTIQAVTDAYQDKYYGQYPIDLMVSDKVAQATVKLVKKSQK